MPKFVQLKPNQLVTAKHFIKKGRKFVRFEGYTGFMAKNYQISIFRKGK